MKTHDVQVGEVPGGGNTLPRTMGKPPVKEQIKDMVASGETCIDTIRFLAVDTVEKAKSGHPGTPMGAAPAKVLYEKFGITVENVVDRAREIQGGSGS